MFLSCERLNSPTRVSVSGAVNCYSHALHTGSSWRRLAKICPFRFFTQGNFLDELGNACLINWRNRTAGATRTSNINSPGADSGFDSTRWIIITRHDIHERKNLPVVDASGQIKILYIMDRLHQLLRRTRHGVHGARNPNPAAEGQRFQCHIRSAADHRYPVS